MDRQDPEILAQNQPESSSPLNRRAALVTGLTALGGIVGLVSEAEAQTNSQTDPILLLLSRITYGATADEVAEARRLGFSGYLERQLAMLPSADTECEAYIQKMWPRVFMNANQLAALPDDWISSVQLQDATFYRMIKSKRQLFIRMCEFWNDHFSMYIWKTEGRYFVEDHNTVVRKHAFGRFPDMLRASAHSPAMMLYLDNAYSGYWAPNQNYAREIMELHTLSVTGGYTQNDVENLTRGLTGWSYEWDSNLPTHTKFTYRDDWHDQGAKTVLGRNIPANMKKEDGEIVLSLLASHPNTAKFIAKKMVRFFLGEGSWATLETSVADTYRRTGGDIKSMIRVILTPANLLRMKPKLKRPAHYYASGLRQMKANVKDVSWTRWSYINQAGQEFFSWAPPNGYPDVNGYWIGLLLPRWNFYMSLMAGWMNEQLQYDLVRLLGNPQTGNQLVDSINRVFFHGAMPQMERSRLQAYVVGKPMDEYTRRSTVALALCAPAYQWM